MKKTKRRNKLAGGSLFRGSFLKTLNGIIGFMGFFYMLGVAGGIECDLIDLRTGIIRLLFGVLVFGITVINYNYKTERGIW